MVELVVPVLKLVAEYIMIAIHVFNDFAVLITEIAVQIMMMFVGKMVREVLENLQAYQNYGYSDYPSGRLRSTSNDLAKLMYAYMNGGVFNGVRILESSTIELIKTIHFPSVNSNRGWLGIIKMKMTEHCLGIMEEI